MSIPGFTAEASLGRLWEWYLPGSADLGTAAEAKIVPQIYVYWGSCRRVSPNTIVCGCENEWTGTSGWCVLRG